MRKTRTRALAAITALLALLGCESRPHESTSAGTLEVASAHPSPGARLAEDSIVDAELVYSIADFAPGQYTIAAQVETLAEGVTSDGDFPTSLYPVLTEPKGKIRFSFPVKHVWRDPSMKHPLVVWLYLTKSTGATTSKIITRVGPLQYSEQ